MEQDAAKIIRKDGKIYVDYNQSGVPLLEIITEPQYTNPEDCKLVIREMQELLSTQGISEASLKNGTMRLDINLSIHDSTSLLKTTNIQIKNVATTPKNVQRAVEYEYRRLVAIIENGGDVETQIRKYDEKAGQTRLHSQNPEV